MTSKNFHLSQRPIILGFGKIFWYALTQLVTVQAAPLSTIIWSKRDEPEGKPPDDPSLWLYLGIAAILVLLGGAFAGLTIALMGQDEIYLQVIRDSGEKAEKKHAAKVLNLLRKGKHWVLVTLLLSNVITNETLPIVLDRSLGGGWPAVLGSTVLIVIFGEIAPQSVCVRYGLPIGSWMAPFVLSLMYVLAPVAWPTAKLLDYLLGEDHGTIYKKAGLKTLVSLHKSLGEAGQQLNSDEVTIISAVLDLKDKAIGSIMTPMDDVFTLSLDDVLDEDTMDDILSQGYSRIPIHHPDNNENFVGMLLVKMLITYDPEDAKPVRDFALATLPETRPSTSCLDIVNFFQEGKSHMVLVSEYPGDDHGALGVVTLEDVIEELIGEEIIDESDIFVDVHKAIRRAMPAPRARIYRNQLTEAAIVAAPKPDLADIGEGQALSQNDLQRAKGVDGSIPKPRGSLTATRRRSSATLSNAGDNKLIRRGTEDLKLGPSNLASKPRSTRYSNVKIKPGVNSTTTDTTEERLAPVRRISESASEFRGGIGEGLVKSGGKEASDGVQALREGYGTLSASPNDRRPLSANKTTEVDPDDLSPTESQKENARHVLDPQRPPSRRRDSGNTSKSRQGDISRNRSPYYHSRGPARSGSITENIVDANGIRKVVLETTSSSDTNEEDEIESNRPSVIPEDEITSHLQLRGGGQPSANAQGDITHEVVKKKKRRRKKNSHNKGEREPLLGNN